MTYTVSSADSMTVSCTGISGAIQSANCTERTSTTEYFAIGTAGAIATAVKVLSSQGMIVWLAAAVGEALPTINTAVTVVVLGNTYTPATITESRWDVDAAGTAKGTLNWIHS